MKIFQDITLGQYFPGESRIHRLDPRTKILSLLMLIITVFSTGNPRALLLIALFVLAVSRLSAFSLPFVARGIGLFFWLFLFTAIFHIFFTPGDSIYPFPLWGVNVTTQGLERGGVVFSQLFLVIFASYLFMLTTSPREMTLGLEKVIRPLKIVGINTEEVALMVALSVRFIPLLKEEAVKIVNAQRCRGVDFGSGTMAERARNIVSVIGPLFGNIFRRTDTLVMAMTLRGFGQLGKRESLMELRLGGGDLLAVMAVAGFSLLILLRY